MLRGVEGNIKGQISDKLAKQEVSPSLSEVFEKKSVLVGQGKHKRIYGHSEYFKFV